MNWKDALSLTRMAPKSHEIIPGELFNLKYLVYILSDLHIDYQFNNWCKPYQLIHF